MSQAYADGSEPPLPNGAKERSYIDLMANQAEMDPSQFVATTVCALGVSTGMQMTITESVNLIDGNLSDNLDNLIDAADYPPWDTLSTSEQLEYGNKQNYDASKYVSLMNAFDLSSGFQRYSDSINSGGATFQFTDGEKGNLAKIARIGKNWANGIGQTMQSIRDCLIPDFDEFLYTWMYGNNTSTEGEQLYNGLFPNDWAEGEYVYYNQTNIGWIKYGTNGNNVMKVESLGDVYLIMRKTSNDYAFNSFNLFSVAPFQWGMNYKMDEAAELYGNSNKYVSASGHEFYYVDQNVSIRNISQSSQAISLFSRDASESKLRFIEEQILFGDSGGGGSAPGELEPDIPSYPTEQVPNTTIVYYPIGGITPETTWNQYTDVQRPENPFNPDDETSTPEWKQETKQNIQGLQGIRFDKLFPFCLYYDLQKFWQKVQTICGIQTSENGTISTQSSNAYDEIEMRFYIPDVMDDTWTFDLEPLRNLLLIVKPFMLVFLIGVEIISLIMLWKGILTGQ